MILSVALSRVYLGVHWISDVGAGIVCGLLWVEVLPLFQVMQKVSASPMVAWVRCTVLVSCILGVTV